MRTRHWLGLTILLGTMGLILGQTSPAHSQRPPKEETLTQRLARETKLTEEQAIKFISAFGPAIREDLKRGKQVTLPGLGTFRVVRVLEHKDMREGGRPIIVPATNTVEFLGSVELGEAANSESAKPAEVVAPFQYILLPGQTPGQKTGRTHVPSTRVK